MLFLCPHSYILASLLISNPHSLLSKQGIKLTFSGNSSVAKDIICVN